MLPVQAGRLRHAIRVEALLETPDGAGGSTSSPLLVAETRAAIEPLLGRERLQALAVQSDQSHTITMRYRAGVTPKCRILYGTRVFRILAARDPEERHRTLILDCVEMPSDVGTAK